MAGPTIRTNPARTSILFERRIPPAIGTGGSPRRSPTRSAARYRDCSQERLYGRRRRLDDHVDQEAVVDDDQEARSALDNVGVLSDTSLGGFLVGP